AQHLDPLDQLGAEVLPRQQAIEAVVGHVVGEDRQPTDQVDLLEIAKATRYPNRGIVEQDVADAGRLLVLDELLRIAGNAERRLERTLLPKDAESRAGGDLPAGIRRRQAFRGGVRAGL